MRLGCPRPQNAQTSEPRLPTRRPRHIRVLSRPRPTDQSALRDLATRPPLACRRAPAPSELPPALPDNPPEEIAAAETFLSFTRVCSLALSPAFGGLTASRGKGRNGAAMRVETNRQFGRGCTSVAGKRGRSCLPGPLGRAWGGAFPLLGGEGRGGAGLSGRAETMCGSVSRAWVEQWEGSRRVQRPSCGAGSPE